MKKQIAKLAATGALFYDMKKLFIPVLLLLLITFKSYAQNTATDSLRQLLATEKQDTSRVLILTQLSKAYLYSKPDTAMLLAQQGLTLSRELKFVRGEAQCLRAIGNQFRITGNYPKSLEALLQSLKLSENMNDEAGVMSSNVNIGVNYNDHRDYKKSLIYFFKAKRVSEAIHNDKVLLIILLDIGDSYEKLNQLDSAYATTQQAYELAVRLNDVNIRGVALNNLGNIYSKMGKDGLAMNHYRQSLPDLESENDVDGVCEATIGMAKLFKAAGQADSARRYVLQSLSATKKGGFTRRILIASGFLSSFYEGIHLIDSAYVYQKITIAAKDSLYSQEKNKELQNLSFTEQMRQQEIAEEKEVALERRKKNIQMGAIGMFIPVFFGIVLLFSKRKVPPKTVGFLGLLGLLLLFEFIALLIHIYIEEWTHDTPVLMLLVLIAVASLLVPMHHRMEHWVKERLVYKKMSTA